MLFCLNKDITASDTPIYSVELEKDSAVCVQL